MKLQDGLIVKLTEGMYVIQAVKNLLIVSRLLAKDTTVGDTRDKMIIKKNGVSMTLDERKGQNNIIMFYFKVKRYAPEEKEALTNIPERKMDTSE